MNVMDYSLIVGIDENNKELVIGMVDYLRRYTWDKHVESWVKFSGLLGHAGMEPTIISPTQYAERFRQVIASYFSMIPALGEDYSHSVCSKE